MTPLTAKLTQALKRRGYSSLRAFHQEHQFSFSYEYLRQVFHGIRVPTPDKVRELAQTLDLNESALLRLASEARIGQRVRTYYAKQGATRRTRAAEKMEQYRRQGRADAKIIEQIALLGEKEKDQLVAYLKYLNRQTRSTRKKK